MLLEGQQVGNVSAVTDLVESCECGCEAAAEKVLCARKAELMCFVEPENVKKCHVLQEKASLEHQIP